MVAIPKAMKGSLKSLLRGTNIPASPPFVKAWGEVAVHRFDGKIHCILTPPLFLEGRGEG